VRTSASKTVFFPNAGNRSHKAARMHVVASSIVIFKKNKKICYKVFTEKLLLHNAAKNTVAQLAHMPNSNVKIADQKVAVTQTTTNSTR